jgi:hypothetical protein
VASPTVRDARHLASLADQLGDRFVGGVVFHIGPKPPVQRPIPGTADLRPVGRRNMTARNHQQSSAYLDKLCLDRAARNL